MRLVVSGPGIEPREAEVTKTFRLAKMPGGGSDVPITIDRANPERFVVQWDEAEGESMGDMMAAMRGRHRSRASTRAAEAVEDALAGHPDAARPFAAEPKRVLFSTSAEAGNPIDASPGALGGDSGADPVDRLAKLADLRDRGALTDAEFEAEKAKILGFS